MRGHGFCHDFCHPKTSLQVVDIADSCDLLRSNMCMASNSISHGYPTFSYFNLKILKMTFFPNHEKFELFFSSHKCWYQAMGHFWSDSDSLHRPVSLALCVSNVRPDMASIILDGVFCPCRWAFSGYLWEDSIYHGRFQWVFKQEKYRWSVHTPALWPSSPAGNHPLTSWSCHKCCESKVDCLRCRDTLLGNNTYRRSCSELPKGGIWC